MTTPVTCKKNHQIKGQFKIHSMMVENVWDPVSYSKIQMMIPACIYAIVNFSRCPRKAPKSTIVTILIKSLLQCLNCLALEPYAIFGSLAPKELMGNKSHQQSDNRWVLRNDGQEVRTLWRLGEGWVQAVHVIAPVAVITKQQLVLEKQKKWEKRCYYSLSKCYIHTR